MTCPVSAFMKSTCDSQSGAALPAAHPGQWGRSGWRGAQSHGDSITLLCWYPAHLWCRAIRSALDRAAQRLSMVPEHTSSAFAIPLADRLPLGPRCAQRILDSAAQRLGVALDRMVTQ